MTINPEPIQPTVVRLDGPGPFSTPPLTSVPKILPGEGQSPIHHLSLIVEPGRELRIPLTQEQARSIWDLLGLFFHETKKV